MKNFRLSSITATLMCAEALFAAVPVQAGGGFEWRLHVQHSAPAQMLEYRTVVYPYRGHDLRPYHVPVTAYRHGPPHRPADRVHQLERIFLADGQIDHAEWRILRCEMERSGQTARGHEYRWRY